MDMVQQVITKVNEVFEKNYLDTLARETGLIKRKRKFDAKLFLEKLILLRLESSHSSLEDLVYEFYKCDTDISKQALHKKFNPAALEFIQKVLEKLLEDTKNDPGKYLSKVPFVKRIQVIDSSQIRLNPLLKEHFPPMRNQGAAVKLQSMMDVLSNQLWLLDVCASNEPDQGYKKHIASTQVGDLLIGDLGYFCVDSFKETQAKGGFFLSRYFKRTHLYDLNTEKQIDLRAILRQAQAESIELQIALGASRFPCRLVAIKLTEEAYQKRLRNLAEKDRKDPRSKTNPSDLLNEWTLFVTNLPLSVEANILLKLYSLRWQIELLFKMIKTFLNLKKVDDVNPNRASISIYISLIAMTLLSYVVMTIIDKEISLYKASKILIKNIRKFFNLINGKKKYAVIWLREQISLFALKESRPNRPSTKLLLEASLCLS